MEFKIEAMDDFWRNIDELKHKAQNVAAPRTVKLSELFPTSFMQAHTKFDSLDAIFMASGVQMDPHDLLSEQKISAEWNAYVAANSDFSDWTDMLSQANAERGRKGPGFLVDCPL